MLTFYMACGWVNALLTEPVSRLKETVHLFLFNNDDDWKSIGFILNHNPWQADDYTDIEYVYLHLLNKHILTTLPILDFGMQILD